MTKRLALALAALALAPIALAQDKPQGVPSPPPKMSNAFRVAEAVFSSTYRATTTRADSDGKGSTTTSENDLTITWKNRASAAGKVAVELRQEGTLGWSSGAESLRVKIGDPPSDALAKIEKKKGPVRSGWDYEIDRATLAVKLTRVYDAARKPLEPEGAFDDLARAAFEEQARWYADRPTDDGASWTTEEDAQIAAGTKVHRKFTFKVDGTQRFKGALCVRVRVSLELSQSGAGAAKIVDQTYDREDLFDVDHGLLARVELDSKLVLEQGRANEERRTEWRWTLESVK